MSEAAMNREAPIFWSNGINYQNKKNRGCYHSCLLELMHGMLGR